MLNRRLFLLSFSLGAVGLWLPKSYFLIKGNPLARIKVVAPFLLDKGHGKPDNQLVDWITWQKHVLDHTGEYVRYGDRIVKELN